MSPGNANAAASVLVNVGGLMVITIFIRGTISSGCT
jgi:hypothetical protein